MQITEPVTMLTDYALGAANLLFAFFILSRMNTRNRVTGLLLLLGFLAEGVAAIAGGTFHGFAKQLDAGIHQTLWNLIMLTAGATIALLASGIHAANVRKENGNWIVAADCLIFSRSFGTHGLRRFGTQS